jgi:hypothetical protein
MQTATANPPAANPPAANPPAASDPPASAGDLSFEAEVWPIFSGGCAPCHTTSNFGNQNIGNPDKDAALADTKRIKDKLLSDLETGRMPPGCGGAPGSKPGCISADDFTLIEDWFADGAKP